MALLTVLLAAMAVRGTLASANIHAGNLEKLIQANTKFAIDLYRDIAQQEGGKNIVYSPVSIAAALAMLKLGTMGNSTAEIDEAMHLSGIEPTLVNSAIGELNGLLFDKPQENVTLKGANGAFISKGQRVLSDYKNALTVFGADMIDVDYTKPKDSASIINKWIAEKTDNKIADMITEDTIGDTSALMLANTLYFTGEWHSGFNPIMTDERAFYVSHYKVIKTPFMFQRGKFKFAFIESHSLQVLELPYSGQEISMIILLPTDFNIQALEKDLSHENLMKWTENMRYVTADVTLPKFTIEEAIDLRAHLQNLGVTNIFDPSKADLSGITGDKSLFVDKVLHKSVLEVTEEGSTAAAATAIRVVARSIQFEAKFLADHPFVWALQHCETGQLLFFGRFSRPEGNEISHEEL